MPTRLANQILPVPATIVICVIVTVWQLVFAVWREEEGIAQRPTAVSRKKIDDIRIPNSLFRSF